MADTPEAMQLSGLESLVMFRNSQGREGRGTLVHITRTMVVFEVYNPYSIVQLSESLPALNIFRGDRIIYKGKAVVSHILTTGIMIIVSASLLDSWSDMSGLAPGGGLKTETERFIQDWSAGHSIRPEYQLIVSTLHNFLDELSHWLQEAEAEVDSNVAIDTSEKYLEDFYTEVQEPILPKFLELFSKFEEEAAQVSPDELMTHKAFARRELHPLTLCSPFVHRTYTKPLGYAGDYEMVNMMLRESSIQPLGTYAKLIDMFHIEASAPEAHRNRIVLLEQRLLQEAERVVADEERMFTVLNVGCGPAVEVQRYIRNESLSNQTSFQLMDFNEETLAYTEGRVNAAITESGNKPVIKFTHKSIDELLKDAHQKSLQFSDNFDMVYCAGLFDYFSDHICKRLVALFYSWIRPGGLVTVTNVHSRNPSRHHMEHLLEWYLVYRDENDMSGLAPKGTKSQIACDETGVNVFLDIRK